MFSNLRLCLLHVSQIFKSLTYLPSRVSLEDASQNPDWVKSESPVG